MRVLQINSVCGIGSTGRIATDIDKVLKGQGHESFIAFGRGNASGCNTTIKIGEKIDNYMHVAKSRLLDMHGFGSNRATKDFIKNIENLNPDIIHLHNIHGYYLNVELLFEYLKKVNKPVVWTLHDCWGFTGHCAYFDYVNCDRWENGCYNCPQINSYPGSFAFDNSKNNYKRKRDIFSGVKNMTIVTPSKWLAKLVEKSFLGNYPVKVINNGIDLEVFKPTESNFRQKYSLGNKLIILGVASVWDKRKGYEYFIDLSQKINKDEVIVMIGLTNQQIKTLPNNIIGISRTDSVKELVDIYSAADIFVNPTLEDNFPTTNLEALACGLPVVTFNTGGSVESIDEKTGLVIEKNSKALLEAINSLKADGKPEYSKHSVQRAIQYYDKKDRFNDYLRLYEGSIRLGS
ncbi:glycosyltransferase family 4 protein [Bacillus luti]|uniref:glycosyltransferase family 4 protein n=1 Tax=Bacillus luti TaxID=2026191 RepID=UPI003D647BA9